MLAFFVVVTLVWFGLHLVLVRWFLPRPAAGTGRYRYVMALVLAAASSLSLVAERFFIPQVTRALRWFGWTYIGGFSTLFALLSVYAVGLRAHAFWIGRKRRSAPPADEALVSVERRAFLLRAGSTTSLGFTVAATGYGVREARRLPQVFEVEVPIEGLPAEFEGYHIVQISDLHVGLTIDKDTILPIVERVTSLGADLVVVTGDVVDGSVDILREDVSPLAYLRAPDGVLCVTGNHEYYSGAEAWVEHFTQLGMRVLNNEHIVLRRGGKELVLAGVTDYGAHRHLESHRSDPVGAIAGAPKAAPKILLAHQPRSAFAAAKAGYALQLSGHTHGGQFFPWNLVVGLVQPVSQGLSKIDGMWVYVNRGTCYWGPPLRSGVPSEITSLRLKRA
jgi:predicted MPP superfamily phosphohydrolase